MQIVTQTDNPGWIKKKFHDFGMGEMFAPLAVNRLEEDDALLSQAVTDLHILHHYPIINTPGHVMDVVASADQVTLAENIVFAVGGVVFATQDQERTFVIPDNTTKFLRASVDPTCGDMVPCASTQDGACLTPLARKLVCAFTLTDGAESDPEGTGGGPSSPTSMRILKAVKGAAGSVPVVTLYGNDGHNPDALLDAHEAADPAHPATKILFDNGTAALPGNPTRVQTAIEALLTLAPVGCIKWFAASSAPTGYLKCNGAAISRTTYASLYAVIGTTFGSGDGSTTFNIPDLRGYFVRGWDDGRGVDTSRTFGTTQADSFAAHTHPIIVVNPTQGTFGGGDIALTSNNGTSDNIGRIVSNGGTETRPKNVALLPCIKY